MEGFAVFYTIYQKPIRF